MNGPRLPMVDILLATFEGARFLEAQLDSLAAQTYANFRVLVRDDGSADGTLDILRAFERRMPAGRVRWVDNPHPGKGALRNFEGLMAASLQDGMARWCMFCDQDDIWLPHKIEAMARAMTSLEGRDGGAGMACLVHCDLRVVDANLRTMAESFMRQQAIDVQAMGPCALLSINHVTGCAMMINRTLLSMALPLPAQAVMHDWWCALLVNPARRVFLAEPLVLYRQHGGNQLGARSRTLGTRMRRLLADGPQSVRRVRWLGRATLAQAQALQRRQHERGLDDTAAAAYLQWRSLPLWRRLATYRRVYQGPELDRACRLLLW